MKNKSGGIVKNIVIILLCIMINIVGKSVAIHFSLPLWLDTIGTCIAAYFTGVWGAVITAIGGIAVYGIFFESRWYYYIITAVIIALFYAVSFKRNKILSFTKLMLSAYWAGIISILISVPVNIIVSGGKSGNYWGGIFFDMLMYKEIPLVFCSICDQLVVDCIDKMLSVAISYLAITLSKKISFKKSMTIPKTFSFFIAFFISLTFVLSTPVDTFAESGKENFVATIYDNKTGLISSEANAIAETDDGYIWIGSYAGLTRFDGKNFEFITEGGITSVTALFTDSKGRLLVGTNDNGIAIYENGKFSFYSSEDGLSANSVRCFAEADDSSIYIGTTDRISKMSPDGKITVLDSSVTYVNSMIYDNGRLICVNNYGELVTIENDKDEKIYTPDAENDYFTCVDKNGDDIFVGTSENTFEKIKITEKGFSVIDRKSDDELISVREIHKDSKGRIWISSDSGIGYVKDKTLYKLSYDDFDSSIEGILEDYQGNIWVASSRYGVMKLSESYFENLFENNNATGSVTNAVCYHNGLYYCGTDNGLVIIDNFSETTVENKLTELLSGARIRCISKDSKDNLWFSTYSDSGLVKYSPDGEIKTFTTIDGTTSDRFRCFTELSDGTLVFGTNSGINFIKNDKVIKTLTDKDGLMNQQILCLLTDENGLLYASSDGDGIYIIKDKKIIDNISLDDGLTSGVILRMIPYNEGFFVVTSNSLCYLENGKARTLSKFPYYNNYDVKIIGEKACILSSAGIYLVDIDELLSDKELNYKLYNYHDGLKDALTANSWNYVDKSGRLYFCTNGGVDYFEPVKSYNDVAEYRYSLSSVRVDGNSVAVSGDTITIPSDSKFVSLEASVRNYLASNPKMRFFIKELNLTPSVYDYKNLESIQITNLDEGEYTVCIQILSDDGEVVSERNYNLVKKPHPWETPLYKFYLRAVTIWIIVATLWMIITTGTTINSDKKMEKMRYQAKSEFLANMSHEFRTPVNTILGMNEMIMNDAESDTVLEYSDNIKTAGARLMTMINDVLDYSTIESGKLELTSEKYDLENLLRDEVAVLKYTAGKKNLETIVVIDDNLPIEVEGDYHRVKQIMDNLVSNAVKYTDDGQITFSVNGESMDDDSFILSVTIADTGSGIADENFEKIFDSFDRLGGKNKAMVEGTGLGLSITRNLVEMMGGTIDVKSVLGSGSVFSVKIPQKISGDKMIGIFSFVPEKKIKKSFSVEGAKVLAVDDNRMNLAVLSGLLKKYGIVPDVAISGEECLHLCETNKYDLILMDHMMPSPDGIETMHKIRNEISLNKETAIVVLTANAVSGAKQKYLDEGFDDYLSKPVETNFLEQVLLKHLPEEMITEFSEEESDALVSDITDSDADEIDKNIGLKYCGSNEELYKEIVESYCTEGRKYKEKLITYIENDDMQNYAIIAHTLKSTSLNIGAKRFSEFAKEHEFAAKQNDNEKIKKSFDNFLIHLDKVISEAETMLGISHEEVSEPRYNEVSNEKYRYMLSELYNYIEGYEMTESLELIDKLLSLKTDDDLSEKAELVLSEIKKLVDDFDYITASEKLGIFNKENGVDI